MSSNLSYKDYLSVLQNTKNNTNLIGNNNIMLQNNKILFENMRKNAENLGGGGHLCAAGAVMEDSLENVHNKVVSAFKGM